MSFLVPAHYCKCNDDLESRSHELLIVGPSPIHPSWPMTEEGHHLKLGERKTVRALPNWDLKGTERQGKLFDLDPKKEKTETWCWGCLKH